MSDRLQQLADNLRNVRRNMSEACRRAGRDPASVRLVAVTKSVTPDVVRDLASLGQTDFGENRVQELLKKSAELSDLAVAWHMIGHLQTNKVKKLLAVCGSIHSVDSVPLAEEIDRRAARAPLKPEVLLEVNVGREEAKFGLAPEELRDAAAAVGKLPHLSLVGLMTMAPLVENPEQTRPVFARLRSLADRVREMSLPGVAMRELSMGMTQDYAVAIEEGATLVRIGTALFQDLS